MLPARTAFILLVASGCASVPEGSQSDAQPRPGSEGASAPPSLALWWSKAATVADRSLRTAGAVGGGLVAGTLGGAAAGFLAGVRAGCNDARACGPVAAAGTAGGAVIGAGKGLGQGLSRAQEIWREE